MRKMTRRIRSSNISSYWFPLCSNCRDVVYGIAKSECLLAVCPSIEEQGMGGGPINQVDALKEWHVWSTRRTPDTPEELKKPLATNGIGQVTLRPRGLLRSSKLYFNVTRIEVTLFLNDKLALAVFIFLKRLHFKASTMTELRYFNVKISKTYKYRFLEYFVKTPIV